MYSKFGCRYAKHQLACYIGGKRQILGKVWHYDFTDHGTIRNGPTTKSGLFTSPNGEKRLNQVRFSPLKWVAILILFFPLTRSSLMQTWHWSCLSRRPFSSSRRYYLFGQRFLVGVARHYKLVRIRLCCKGKVFASTGGCHTQHKDIQAYCIQYNARHLYLSTCLPLLSSLRTRSTLYRLVISRATHYGMCSSASKWTSFFS